MTDQLSAEFLNAPDHVVPGRGLVVPDIEFKNGVLVGAQDSGAGFLSRSRQREDRDQDGTSDWGS